MHGPLTPVGRKGERYFVTYIDDFSKIAVVYCMKHKSEVFDHFVEYYNIMKNLTGRKIKQLRCDNGLEYINKNTIHSRNNRVSTLGHALLIRMS